MTNKLLTFRGLSKSLKHFTKGGISITMRFAICINPYPANMENRESS